LIVAPPLRSTGGLLSMPSLDSGADENKAKGNMWALDQALDKPMDDEAGRLRDMHGERVSRFIFIFIFDFAICPLFPIGYCV